ncbi:unnamed protein product [Pieris macdunnoughi]|uniref:Uncharacterized protein n=1 Tax=Pieris macdunnoughi TaxID=345717 RepID=A0A821W735_9NEOP|nr:unnamed protein product [Pieris macdunnoughi]
MTDNIMMQENLCDEESTQSIIIEVSKSYHGGQALGLSTSNSASIISQLSLGITLPPKRAGKTKRKVTASNLGLETPELIRLVNSIPSCTIPEILKAAYKKKGTWGLINNTYDVQKYSVLEET